MTDIASVEKDHSSRGPSSAYRWMNCVGSPRLIAKLKRSSSITEAVNRPASEGTAAHTLLLDICLANDEDAWEHNGREISADDLVFTVDAEMQDAVQEALDWIRARLKENPGALLIIERRVASPEGEDTFGSLDVGILIPGVKLIIADFKYGRKVVVEPDHEQLKLYGHYTFETFKTFGDILGAEDENAEKLLFPDPNTPCELWIMQPRIPHPESTIRKYDTTKAELARFFYGEALPAYQASFEEDAPLCVGDWCRFCPAMEFCPAINSKRQEFYMGDPVVLNDADLNDVCIYLEQIIAQGAKLKSELYRRAMLGSQFKDWKLVKQKSDRVWKEGAEFEIRETYGSAAYTKPALLSPAQIEKLEGGKNLVSKLAMKQDTGLTIAKATDRRKAATVTDAMKEFDKHTGAVEEGPEVF